VTMATTAAEHRSSGGVIPKATEHTNQY